MDKDKIIAQVYNDPLGFGSNHNTLKDARKIDPTITLQDITKWKNSNIERTTQLKVVFCSALLGYLAATAGEHSKGRQAASPASGAERPPPTSTSEEG